MKKGTKIALGIGCAVFVLGGILFAGLGVAIYYAVENADDYYYDDYSYDEYGYDDYTDEYTDDLDTLDGYDDDAVFLYTSEDGAEFSMLLPLDWYEEYGLNDAADFQASNGEHFMIVLTEPKADFAEDLTVQGYYDLLEADFSATLSPTEPVVSEPVELDFYSGVQADVFAEVDSLNIGYLITAAETDNHWHQIWLWTNNSKYEAAKPTFETITASILDM